jgi:REP-associated tyrosine transposase
LEVLVPYCQLYYHFVWRTKASTPWIVPAIEEQVHRLLWKKALGLRTQVYAINGMEDHVHVVASLPPVLAVADFVGQVKGYSSNRINKEQLLDTRFGWQAEYGAFSFDRKRLPYVIAYVENQKRHHAEGATIRILERTDSSIDSEIREPPSCYDFDGAEWRRELEELDDDDSP